MPGVRDRNLRSGDLHEELGLLLLRLVGLIAPVPRPEDVGTDAFVTLVRPEGSRRLLPDLSFLVQLKAASVQEVSYSRPDSVAWIKNLEIPLFIGSVDLKAARIELFSTQRLHEILIETDYQEICLLLHPGDESAGLPKLRRAYIGPPVHAWSIADAAEPEFLMHAHEILRPHVERLRENRQLRDLRYLRLLKWETGYPPTDHAIVMTGRNKAKDALESMVPSIHRLLTEIMLEKRYGDFHVLLAIVQMMRRWGVDPDPGGEWIRSTTAGAEGPEISDEEVIRLRYAARMGHLNLGGLALKEESLAAIPDDVEDLVLSGIPITEAGARILVRRTRLSHLNISGTGISDSELDLLAALRELRWLNVTGTQVTDVGIARLKASLPNLEIVR